jgi:hypothetical protein
MENNQLVLVDAKEFGIEESKALQVTQAFTTELAELALLDVQFNEISVQEITPELVKLAKELRLKYVKKRTTIAKIHKSEKEFYLATSKFIDALKNKATAPIEIKEEKLQSVELHFENLEKERIKKLLIERAELLQPFNLDLTGIDLANMQNDVFDAYFAMVEKKHFEKIEAEKQAELERIEQERINNLHQERNKIALPYFNFWSEFEKTLNFGTQSESDFKAFMNRNINADNEHRIEQAKIKTENERLQKQADELALKLENERKESEAKAKAIEEENQRKLDAERKKAKEEADELARKNEALRKKQADEMKVIQDKIQQDRANSIKEENERKLAEENAKKAPLKVKVLNWIETLNEFNSEGLTPEQLEIINPVISRLVAYKNWAKEQTNKL